MCSLRNNARPISLDETSGASGISTVYSDGNIFKDTIKKANLVSLSKILKFYNVRIDPYSHKAICPFSDHKGGRENTPSFELYEDTNSFYCHGCRYNRSTTDFVAKMDGTAKILAAKKILKIFKDDIIDDEVYLEHVDFNERLNIMLDFSSSIRNFILSHSNKDGLVFIETWICKPYDIFMEKHNPNNEVLLRFCNVLKEKMKDY